MGAAAEPEAEMAAHQPQQEAAHPQIQVVAEAAAELLQTLLPQTKTEGTGVPGLFC